MPRNLKCTISENGQWSVKKVKRQNEEDKSPLSQSCIQNSSPIQQFKVFSQIISTSSSNYQSPRKITKSSNKPSQKTTLLMEKLKFVTQPHFTQGFQEIRYSTEKNENIKLFATQIASLIQIQLQKRKKEVLQIFSYMIRLNKYLQQIEKIMIINQKLQIIQILKKNFYQEKKYHSITVILHRIVFNHLAWVFKKMRKYKAKIQREEKNQKVQKYKKEEKDEKDEKVEIDKKDETNKKDEKDEKVKKDEKDEQFANEKNNYKVTKDEKEEKDQKDEKDRTNISDIIITSNISKQEIEKYSSQNITETEIPILLSLTENQNEQRKQRIEKSSLKLNLTSLTGNLEKIKIELEKIEEEQKKTENDTLSSQDSPKIQQQAQNMNDSMFLNIPVLSFSQQTSPRLSLNSRVRNSVSLMSSPKINKNKGEEVLISRKYSHDFQNNKIMLQSKQQVYVTQEEEESKQLNNKIQVSEKIRNKWKSCQQLTNLMIFKQPSTKGVQEPQIAQFLHEFLSKRTKMDHSLASHIKKANEIFLENKKKEELNIMRSQSMNLRRQQSLFIKYNSETAQPKNWDSLRKKTQLKKEKPIQCKWQIQIFIIIMIFLLVFLILKFIQ